MSAKPRNIVFYILYFVAFCDKERWKGRQKYMCKTNQKRNNNINKLFKNMKVTARKKLIQERRHTTQEAVDPMQKSSKRMGWKRVDTLE